ncbi:hypothetical protein GGS24DRAFT_440742 [Hypoxylon argillaceum]|nr:hypothetical protein GGS24DRAFT_440742 [Hypoxylon argillaceum]
MSFQFVDNSDINKKARKLIRSHVMKGKNCGKVRTRRNRHPKLTVDKPTVVYKAGNSLGGNEITITTPENPQWKSSILAVTKQLANDPSLLSSTARLAPQTMLHLQQLSLFILDVISPPEFCQYTGITEWMWFQLTFYNEAYFHCTIAMASACAAFITEDSNHSPVALYHMSQAYRLINQDLSSSEAFSDTTIAVVAAINLYDRLYGDPQKAMIHLEGVTRMIAIRGGIRELAKRSFIIAEKAFRSDIELAIHCRSKPKFSSTDVPRHLILIDPRDCPEHREQAEAVLIKSVLYQSVCAELREVVLDVLRFSCILDQASRGHKLDPPAYQTTLVYISYRLLETKLPPASSETDHDHDFNILIQLALIGFQNTFCFGIGRKLITFPLLVEDFRSVAQTISEDDKSRKMVVFWALLMGRVSSLTKNDDLWFIPKFKALANELGFRTWPEVSNALCAFPWVKIAHDAQGEEFWNTATAAS